MNAQLAPAADSPQADSGQVVSLATLHRGDCAIVSGVTEDEAALGDELGSTLVMRLIEIGFVAGERIEIIGEARPGGDPLAVRVGGTCFALRRREAAAVMVTRLPAALA